MYIKNKLINCLKNLKNTQCVNSAVKSAVFSLSIIKISRRM